MWLTETHQLCQGEIERQRDRNHERKRVKKRQSDGEGEFYDGIRFQWENEVKHFITGRYLLKCKQRLGISKVKLCVCGEGNR